MRQKDDHKFTELLNRFRTATQTEDDIKSLQSTSITPSDRNYPSDALHIWAEIMLLLLNINNHHLQQISSVCTPSHRSVSTKCHKTRH